MAVISELVTEFKFEGGTGPLDEYNASLGSGVALLAGFTAAIAASGVAISKWASDVLGAFDSTAQLSRATGESVEWIQEMGYVASVSGGSVQGFQSTVESLTSTIGDAAQKGNDDFNRLGISVKYATGQVKSSEQVLGEVRASFKRKNLSMSEQRSFASSLGIDSSLLQMMSKTDAQLGKLKKRAQGLGILDKDQADQVVAYNNALTTLRFGFDGLQNLIAVGLSPELEAMADRFSELLAINKKWIIEGVKAGMEQLRKFMDILIQIGPELALVTGALLVFKFASLGVAKALAFVTSPAVLIAAGLLAITFVVDDLVTAFNGGESVIQKFFLKFFDYDILPVLQGIVDGVKKLGEGFKIVWGEIKDVIAVWVAWAESVFSGLMKILGSDLSGFSDAFKAVFDIMSNYVQGVITVIGGVFSAFFKSLKGDFAGAFADIKVAFDVWVKTLGDAFKSIFGGVFEWFAGKMAGMMPDWAKKFLGMDSSETTGQGDTTGMAGLPGIAGTDPSFQPGGSVTNSNRSSSITQENKIEIRTADPERAGRAVADNLQRQMADAQAQTCRGGM
jgi:hypothetical protein